MTEIFKSKSEEKELLVTKTDELSDRDRLVFQLIFTTMVTE